MSRTRSTTKRLAAVDQLVDGGAGVGKAVGRARGRATRKAREGHDRSADAEFDLKRKGDHDMTREFDRDVAEVGKARAEFDRDAADRDEVDRDEVDRDEVNRDEVNRDEVNRDEVDRDDAERDDAQRRPTPSEGDLDAIDADGELVARCVAGEVGAWEELYNQCHAPLLLSIRCLLGQAVPDRNLIDELAARVWYALIDNDGKLLARFDKQRGARLGTFLRCVAKDVTARHFRTEIRRRRRERVAGKRHETKRRATGDAEAAMAEFVDTLSPAEQAFLEQHLLGNESADGEGMAYSQANLWQIASRIRRKFQEFFSQDETGDGEPGDS